MTIAKRQVRQPTPTVTELRRYQQPDGGRVLALRNRRTGTYWRTPEREVSAN